MLPKEICLNDFQLKRIIPHTPLNLKSLSRKIYKKPFLAEKDSRSRCYLSTLEGVSAFYILMLRNNHKMCPRHKLDTIDTGENLLGVVASRAIRQHRIS